MFLSNGAVVDGNRGMGGGKIRSSNFQQMIVIFVASVGIWNKQYKEINNLQVFERVLAIKRLMGGIKEIRIACGCVRRRALKGERTQNDVLVVTGATDFVFTDRSEIQLPCIFIHKLLLDCGAVQADALTVDRLALMETYFEDGCEAMESILATEI